MEEIGGFAETCFGILTIVFATYAHTNFKLSFVASAFKQRQNDAPYDPSVYDIGVTLDKNILSNLKDFVEPTNMAPTSGMYIYDMFEDLFEVMMKII